MAELFVVVIDGMTSSVVYGPFADRDQADDFAKFATEEIDPAYVRKLTSPVGELLAWRQASKEWADA